MEKIDVLGEEINIPNIIEVLHRKTRRIHRLEAKLKAIKKHYDNRPKVVHAPLWFMKLGKILEAEG